MSVEQLTILLGVSMAMNLILWSLWVTQINSNRDVRRIASSLLEQAKRDAVTTCQSRRTDEP